MDMHKSMIVFKYSVKNSISFVMFSIINWRYNFSNDKTIVWHLYSLHILYCITILFLWPFKHIKMYVDYSYHVTYFFFKYKYKIFLFNLFNHEGTLKILVLTFKNLTKWPNIRFFSWKSFWSGWELFSIYSHVTNAKE